MSRNLPWLAELQPEMFAEIDPLLAAERGIEDGGWMVIETARAEIEARARVTERMRPLRMEGQPCTRSRCRGTGASAAHSPGDSANDLGALAPTRTSRSRRTRRSPATSAPVAASGETTARLAGVH